MARGPFFDQRVIEWIQRNHLVQRMCKQVNPVCLYSFVLDLKKRNNSDPGDSLIITMIIIILMIITTVLVRITCISYDLSIWLVLLHRKSRDSLGAWHKRPRSSWLKGCFGMFGMKQWRPRSLVTMYTIVNG